MSYQIKDKEWMANEILDMKKKRQKCSGAEQNRRHYAKFLGRKAGILVWNDSIKRKRMSFRDKSKEYGGVHFHDERGQPVITEKDQKY